jgi:ketosteroid isomerase-like protein
MTFTIKQIAEAFSTGKFETAYPCLADDVVWLIPGENSFEGKEAVIANCKTVASYFKTITTSFKTTNIITSNNCVVIDGTAEFSRDGKRVSFVWACDVYEFNDDNKLKKITSYCIPEK